MVIIYLCKSYGSFPYKQNNNKNAAIITDIIHKVTKYFYPANKPPCFCHSYTSSLVSENVNTCLQNYTAYFSDALVKSGFFNFLFQCQYNENCQLIYCINNMPNYMTE